MPSQEYFVRIEGDPFSLEDHALLDQAQIKMGLQQFGEDPEIVLEFQAPLLLSNLLVFMRLDHPDHFVPVDFKHIQIFLSREAPVLTLVNDCHREGSYAPLRRLRRSHLFESRNSYLDTLS